MIPARARVVVGLAALLGSLAPAEAKERSRRRAAAFEHGGERYEVREAIVSRRGRAVVLKVIRLGWAELEVRTARAFLAMRTAAARDGVKLDVRSGFRDRMTQAWLYRAWRRGWGNPAARPGYSNHESGQALDLRVSDGRTRSWLRRYARDYGFRATVRGEPWHWELTAPPSQGGERLARRGPAQAKPRARSKGK